MTLYTAFVMTTLTILAILIIYGEWNRKHTVNESVPADLQQPGTNAHVEPEPIRRAA